MQVFERIRLQLKGMGLLALVPLVGCLLFLPFGTWLLNRGVEDIETRYLMVLEVSYQFMPLFSVFWLYLFHHEYVEGEGREVLLLGRGVSGYTFFYYVLTLPFFWCSICLMSVPETHRMDFFLEMVVCSFFLCSLAYFLNFSLGKISLSFLCVLLYIFLCNVDIRNTLALNGEEGMKVPSYFYTVLKESGGTTFPALCYLAVGVVFWLLGWYRSKQV